MAAEPAPRCDGVRTIRTDRRPFQHRHCVASVNTKSRSIPALSSSIASAYPNLTALFEHLGVPTQTSDMSLAVSLRDGDLEYSGTGLRGLFAQPRNLFRPRFWSMLRDLAKFYRQATRDADLLKDETVSLGDYLAAGGYGAAFRDDHLLPMASAIWSAPPSEILSFPVATFIRFHRNHGLLQLTQRPAWETVVGGSIVYVQRLIQPFADRIRLDTGVVTVQRIAGGVVVTDSRGGSSRYDHVVMATHADQALSALADPTSDETELLGAFRYSRNLAVLHSDPSFMPRRRAAWSSWNYIGSRDGSADSCRRHLLDEPAARHSRHFAAVSHPQPAAPAARRRRCITARFTIIRSSTPPRYRRSAGCGRCKARATSGSAARISARVFMRTDCRQASPSPNNSAGCGGRGACPNESGRIVLGREGRGHDDAGAAAMSFRSALYVGAVMHRRLRPTVHQFRYRAFWLLIDLDELPALTARLRLFSHNRFNLFACTSRSRRRQRDTASHSGRTAAVGSGHRYRGRPHPPALHAANARLQFQSDQHLFLPSARRGTRRDHLRSPQHVRRAPLLRRRHRDQIGRDPAKLPQGVLRISVHGYGPGLPLSADRARGARRGRHQRQQGRRTRPQCQPRRASPGIDRRRAT